MYFRIPFLTLEPEPQVSSARDVQPPPAYSLIPPAYDPITETSVLLQVRNPGRDYTNGDTISGSLNFKVSAPSITILRVKARLTCTEAIDFAGPADRVNTTHFSREKNLLSGRSKRHKLSYGVHRFPFKFVLDSAITKCPPTLSFPELERERAGIHWILEAWVVEADSTLRTHALRDSTRLNVYPFDRDAELSRYEKGMKAPLSSNTRDTVVLPYRKFKIELDELPNYIPQPPEAFSMRITVVPYERVYLGSISVDFEQSVDLTAATEWEANRSVSYELRCADYSRVLDPKDTPVVWNLEGCVLNGTTAPSFELSNISLLCRLNFHVRADSGSSGGRVVNVDLASPSRLRNEVAAEVTDIMSGNEWHVVS